VIRWHPMKVAADLHVHSSLSPCGSLEMSPRAIVERALELGLQLIAVTDHNSMANAFYAADIGARLGLPVLCGMEAQTREDVHLLCLFEDRRMAGAFADRVYGHLPDMENNPDYFGDQVVVDGEENVVRFEPRLLMNGLDLSLGEVVELTRAHGGVVIPSHVESSCFGLLPALGLLPPELEGCPLEISYCTPPERALAEFPALKGRRLLTNSDAHYLADMGRAWTIYEPDPFSLESVYRSAQQGRYTVCRPGR
jgi:3',5'-nucleoside bisphosphate phosphatase